MMKWILILCTVFLSSTGDVLCAKGMSEGGELQDFRPSGLGRMARYIATRRMVILGASFYAAAFFSLLGLLSIAQLSIAVPATALSFVVDTLGAYFILHEHVHWRRWIGVLCATAGVVLAAQYSAVSPGNHRPHAPLTEIQASTGSTAQGTLSTLQHSLLRQPAK